MRALKLLAVIGPLSFAVPTTSRADDECGSCGRRAYGDYCDGQRWGRYGAKEPVKTVKEARERLESFFENEDVVVGRIKEKATYYEAEITTSHGELVDHVIIDKRTGRIRSIY